MIAGVIVLLPLFLMGLIFASYGMANLSKARSQYLSLNLVHIGAYSSEFDTNESLEAMAAFAHAGGFPASVAPDNNQDQDFPGFGQLKLNHDKTTIGKFTIDTFVRFESSPLGELVAYLGNVGTASFSGSEPDELYISVSIDNSKSLINDHRINDLLCAFNVSDCNPSNVNAWGEATGVGANGMAAPMPANSPFGWSNEVWPATGVRPLIPFLPVPAPGVSRSWRQLPTEYPPKPWPNSGCVLTGENWCGGLPANHRQGNDNRITDLYMSYKKVATLLVGLVAQITPYIDVSLLAAPWPSQVQCQWNVAAVGFCDTCTDCSTSISGNPVENPLDYQNASGGNYVPGSYVTEPTLTSNNMYIFGNTGNEPIWLWDQDVRSNLTQPGGIPQFSAVVAPGDERDRDNPRNIFRDSVSLMPDNRYQDYLLVSGWRKMATYATAYSNIPAGSGPPVSFSVEAAGGDVADFFRPPFPLFDNPPNTQITASPDTYYTSTETPQDAFVWNPGPRHTILDYFTGQQIWKHHFDSLPTLFQVVGPAHPTVLPKELEDAFEYVCPVPGGNWLNSAGGVRSSLNVPLSDIPGSIGHTACMIADFCRSRTGFPAVDPNCNGPLNTTVQYLFFDDRRNGSPLHQPDDESPRCPSPYWLACYNRRVNPGVATLDTEFSPVEFRGRLFCQRHSPATMGPDINRYVGCYDPGAGAFVSVVPEIISSFPLDPLYPLSQNPNQPIIDPGHGITPITTTTPTTSVDYQNAVNVPVHYNSVPGSLPSTVVASGNPDPMVVNLATDSAPHYLGSLAVPSSAPTILHHSLLYFLMDLSIRVGGTWTAKAIEFARIRSLAFPPGKRVMLLLTDGIPQATLEDGSEIFTAAEYVTNEPSPNVVDPGNSILVNEMIQFTDPNGHRGISFTWLLGQANNIEDLRASVSNWITNSCPNATVGVNSCAARIALYNDHIGVSGPPVVINTTAGSESMCAGFPCSTVLDNWQPYGVNTGEFNDMVEDYNTREVFKCIMGDPVQSCNTEQRYLVETSIQATASGANVSNINSFLGGLNLVASLLKRTVRLTH